MDPQRNPASLTSDSFDAALAEYMRRVDQGAPVDLSELAAAYPGCAAQLQEFLRQEGKLHAAFAPPAASPETRPGATLGDFRILRELGRGGMGVVYEAEQTSLGRRVALKVLPFGAMLDKQQLARFKNEARAAATLDHPHVVAVHAVGSERDVHYYAMQLVEGHSLAHVIASLRRAARPLQPTAVDQAATYSTAAAALSTGVTRAPDLAWHTSNGDAPPMDPPAAAGAPDRPPALPEFGTTDYFRQVAQLGIEAAQALDHAHQNGILHRDVKPGNLLLDRAGKLLIADFGLARIEADAGMTMTGDVLGTLRYMSPEQTLGRRAVVDHRSDVYSLGATLYELLSLEPVFGETERSDLLKQIAEQEPRAPRQINGRIPADLETIVLQAMRKIPDQRYATAQDLADDLQRFLDDQPIRAKPPTWRERAVKWSRRHPAALWTAAAVLTVLAIASTTSAVLIGEAYQRESQQREQAEQQREMAEVQRREAETQRERAENHFRRVRVAVSEILVQAAEGRGMWEDIPSRLRKEFAKRVLSFYEGYVQQESSDRDVQFETAVAYISLANMAAVNKDLEQAETFLRQSRTILADLSEAHPESFEYRQQLAWANYRLGVVLDQRGDTSLAETTIQAAIDIYRQLIVEGPETDDYAVEIASCLTTFDELRAKRGEPRSEQGRQVIALIQDLLRENALTDRGFWALGHLYVREELWDEAIGAYREAIRLAPENPSHLTRLGDLLSERGQHDEALTLFRQAVDINPNEMLFLNRLGNILADVGQTDEAMAVYRKAIELFPDDTVNRQNLAMQLLAAGKLDEAAAELRKTMQLGDDDPLVRRTLANAFYQQGRYEEAVTEYREVLRLHPEDVETLIYYGYALLQLGQLEASVAALREATRVAPSVSRGWVHLGTALRRLGKIEESIEALRMAVQVDPEDDGYLHMQLGNALYEHGSRDEATRVFQKMMTLMRERREREPGNHDVLRELAGELATCRETSLRDYDEAVQIMEQAVELAPESSKNWRMLGVARYRAGQFREAVEAFERAGDDGPDMSWPFFYRAMAEWRLGNHEAANDWYAKGIHWMEQHNQFTEPARVRLRDEAAELLGIASPADARVDEVANASPLAE